MRYHSDGKELRRQRLYEKALDVCATSPFARFVQRWVLAGVGHGARLAAVVGSRARGTVCGYVFVSYPVSVSPCDMLQLTAYAGKQQHVAVLWLWFTASFWFSSRCAHVQDRMLSCVPSQLPRPGQSITSVQDTADSPCCPSLLPAHLHMLPNCVQDALQTAKGPLLPDSSILLLRIQAPSLFVQAAGDSKNPAEQMRKVAAQMKPATVPRLVEIPDVDAAFAAGDPPVLQPDILTAVTQPIVDFVNALGDGKVDGCDLSLANPSGTAAAELSENAAAGIKAQIQVLDADDTAIYDVEPLGKPGEPPGGANGAAQQQKAAQQQQLLQQQLQLQVLQQQQVQQAQLAAAAAKAGINMQQAAAQRAAAAAAGKLPTNLAAAAAAAAASGGAAGGAAASGAPVVAPMMLGAGGFAQITPQMLAAAQAMQLAAAKQGIRPPGQVMMPGAAAGQQQGPAAAQGKNA